MDICNVQALAYSPTILSHFLLNAAVLILSMVHLRAKIVCLSKDGTVGRKNGEGEEVREKVKRQGREREGVKVWEGKQPRVDGEEKKERACIDQFVLNV